VSLFINSFLFDSQDRRMGEESERTDPTRELLEALRLAIRAMNATPSFETGIPNPERKGRTLRSYELLPKLEAIVRKYEGPS
jgi:hypothetical protein